MRKNVLIWFLLIVFVTIAACGGQAPSEQVSQPAPEKAGLWIVSGSNAMTVLGDGKDGLLLAQWAKANSIDVYVQKLSGPEAKNLKDQALKTGEGPDVFVFDDGLYADGLYNTQSVAQSAIGLWVEKTAADGMGLTGNTIAFDRYVELLDAGVLKTVAGNASSSTPSAEHFFSVLAWCSKSDASNLTMEIVNDQAVRVCGKDVYDHIKTTDSTSSAIGLVYDGIVNNQGNSFNSVIAFDSSFLGKGGKNETMIQKSGTFMKFFYFEEATPISVVTFGSKNLTADVNKNTLVVKLAEYLTGEEAQKAFNLAGLGNGASALVTPDESAFVADWGVTMYPSAIVNVINPPVPAVAFDALVAYVQLYKRTKVVDFYYDTSGSTGKQDISSINLDGNPETIIRLQAIARTIGKFTDPAWQSANGITVGPGDVFKHHFFATLVSQQISESVGPDTLKAGEDVTWYIGPAYGEYFFNDDFGNPEVVYNNEKVTQLKSSDGVTPYSFGGTAIFEAANSCLNGILANYNPNVDYYCVVLTDGEWTEGMPGVPYKFGGEIDLEVDSFYRNWLNAGKENISFIGIQFGPDGNSLDEATVTKLMNGATYDGANDAELVEAFKKILSN